MSTDYDESDRLYFEELSCERVLDIYEREVSQGVIVSVGGQIANNLALPLHRQGVNILGTAPEMIDTAEDRHKFSALLDRLGVDQPKWIEFSGSSKEKMKSACDKMGYPVLVRPSFVLSGAATLHHPGRSFQIFWNRYPQLLWKVQLLCRSLF